MRIYLAGRYGRRAELAALAKQLEWMGHVVTSRWLQGAHEAIDGAAPPQLQRAWAVEDMEDIFQCELLVMFGETPGTPGASRGGHKVEFGLAIGMDKQIGVVGVRSTVFEHLKGVRYWESSEGFMDWAAEFASVESSTLKREQHTCGCAGGRGEAPDRQGACKPQYWLTVDFAKAADLGVSIGGVDAAYLAGGAK